MIWSDSTPPSCDWCRLDLGDDDAWCEYHGDVVCQECVELHVREMICDKMQFIYCPDVETQRRAA